MLLRLFGCQLYFNKNKIIFLLTCAHFLQFHQQECGRVLKNVACKTCEINLI